MAETDENNSLEQQQDVLAAFVDGECIVPERGAVHLVYRARALTGRTDSLSLWINRYPGEPDVEPG